MNSHGSALTVTAAPKSLCLDMPVMPSVMQTEPLDLAKPKGVFNDQAMVPRILPDTSGLQTVEFKVFHWLVENWKDAESKSYSPSFVAGGFTWRILLYPKGNGQHESLSLYLKVEESSANIPDWHVCAQFGLVISNPDDPTQFYSNQAQHRFCGEEVDWGFTRFCEIKALPRAYQGKGPFLINNRANFSVYLRVVKDETGVLWHNLVNYDSRKETGFVGIKNQGATCYMNSILQSLYCTNSFRKAVYQVPTETEDPTKSVALALQRCFYNLQSSNDPVGTTELTRSFGWDTLDAFMQHDVQEFNRVLQDNLEMKMKGTPAGGTVRGLFVGKMKSYIKCLQVDYESSRVEDFYDIQLNVKGCKDLHESFKEYIAVETMEGENKYMAEGYGLQDAQKGVFFESFPPVLHLQLKRFEYDMKRDSMVKINDHHEFPESINLDTYCSKSGGDEAGPFDYTLYGVLVHSGDLDGGHYFALIKPEKNGKWFRFDDDRVTPVTLKEVYQDNFGDEPLRGSNDPSTLDGKMRNGSAQSLKRFTNAYMLVYIRTSKVDEILAPVVDEDIPAHLSMFIEP
ncbi:hypothetical protein CLU79DRAFT_839835 [Phycomyces nitens]|nr:hypothetical protein CLU79DRAFT_839835 [Phycomyces nitens]